VTLNLAEKTFSCEESTVIHAYSANLFVVELLWMAVSLTDYWHWTASVKGVFRRFSSQIFLLVVVSLSFLQCLTLTVLVGWQEGQSACKLLAPILYPEIHFQHNG